MMVIRIATVTAVFAKKHMQQIREALVWRGSPLARTHTHTHIRACVYAYLGGFKVIMDSYCVIPDWDSTRTRWLKEQSDSWIINFQCFAHCAGSSPSISFCLCHQYHIVKRPKEQQGKIIYQIIPAPAERWQRNALVLIQFMHCVTFPFLSALSASVFSLFHLPLYFLFSFLHPLAFLELYRASSEEMFSHSRSPNCYTSHPSGKTHCGVL